MKKNGNRTARILIEIIVLLLLGLLCAVIIEDCDPVIPFGSGAILTDVPETEGPEPAEDVDYNARITVIDVGQGSAALIESGGEIAFIDTGSVESAQVPIAILKRLQVEKVSLILNTHWDSDHCGATVGILKNYPVDLVLGADYETDTRTYQSLKKALEEQKVPFRSPVPGETFTIGKCTIRTVGPMRYDCEDENRCSISVILSDGHSSVYFGGDTTADGEREILESGADIDCDLYVCNHHGSAYSSCEEFLRAMSPKYTVISCGKDNEYGHPAESTLKRLRDCSSEIYRTDLQGDVVFLLTEQGIEVKR